MRPRTARSCSPPSRATCTTSARTSSASCSQCNNYDVVDLGVMVPAEKILQAAIARAGRHHRPVRPDHAVARRDVPCRGRDGAAGLRRAAPDRRSDHEPRAHGGENPSQLPARADGLCQRREPRRRRGVLAAVARRRARAPSTRSAPNTPASPPRMRAARRTNSGCRLPTRAPTRCGSIGPATYRPPAPRILGTQRLAEIPIAELYRIHRLDAVLRHLGVERQIPGDPRRRQKSAKRRAACSPTRRTMLQRIAAERWFRASAVIGLWPANSEGDDILIFADEARRSRSPCCTRCASNCRAAKAAPMSRSPISSRRAPAGLPIISAPSRSPPASARKRSSSDSSTPTTIIRRSWPRRSPTGWPKRSPSACTSAYAGNFGPMRRTKRCAAGELIAEKYRGIRPAPGYPAQPDHTEKATLFNLLDGERQIGVQLTESFAMWPGASVCGALFQPSRKLLFRRRQDRARPGRGLRAAQGLDARTGREMAGADSQLRSAGGGAQRR